jgi:adenosine deaminase
MQQSTPASTSEIAKIPKVELHLHLEGAVGHAVAAKMRRKYEPNAVIEPPAAGFKDLETFLAVYDGICRYMRDAEDFRDATWHALSRCAASNVRHVELFFSPDAHAGVAYSEMLDGILAAFDQAWSEFGMSALLIPAHNRELGPDRGMAFLDKVLSDRRERVVGIGLDYAERPNPAPPFAKMYERARAEGLRVTAHAGEDGPAEYVRDTVDLLGCRRIDHGYHIVDDPELVARCRDLDVLFTVCPTTTLSTTIWRDLSARDHAIRRMIEAGLRVTIATDDPGLFMTELNREYGLVAENFGLSDAKLREIALNGATHSWLSNDGQQDLLERCGVAA